MEFFTLDYACKYSIETAKPDRIDMLECPKVSSFAADVYNKALTVPKPYSPATNEGHVLCR